MKKKIAAQVFVLGFVSLFTDIASEMLYPVTPIFLSAGLGISMFLIGVIEGTAEITAGILKGYFGYLSDKIGKRSVFIVAGYGISAISKPIPGLIPHFISVFITRITDRIGKGIRTAPRDALLASYSEGNTGAVFGLHRGMDTLGAAIGPVLALILLNIYPGNYQLIFLIAFIPSLVALSFTLVVKDKQVNKVIVKNKTSYINFWKSAPSEYKRLIILLTIFALSNSSDVFLILKSKKISGSDSLAIIGYIYYNIIYALASYPIGLLADKLGKKKVFIYGLFIFSIVYFGFAVSNGFVLMWVLFALYGIYAASTEGIAKAWVSDIIPDERRGTAIGLLTMLSSIAVFIGSILAGYLWDAFGGMIPFLLSSVISIAVAIILMSSNMSSKKISA